MKEKQITRADWDSLIWEFKRYETVRGKKSVRKIPYVLRPFLVYLEKHDYELYEINYKRAQDYQTYLTTLEDADGSIHYSAMTIGELMNTVRNFYNYLKAEKLVHSNPFKNLRFIRREGKLPRHIPKEDVMDKFLNSLKCFWKEKTHSLRRNLYKIHVIAELMYATGLRLSEVAKLKVSDVDLAGGMVSVREGKGGRDRKAYLNEYACRVLRIYIEEMREYINWNKDSDHVFGVKDGRNLDPVLNRWLKKKGERAGIERFTSHTFRHAVGFHLLRRGCGLRFIQLILGHEEINSTVVYTKVDKTDLRSELDVYHPRKFKSLKERK